MARRRPEQTIVVFGASGDLMGREVAPAILSLWWRRLLPRTVRVVGVAKEPLTDESFRSALGRRVSQASGLGSEVRLNWKKFAPHLTYLQGDLEKPGFFRRLNQCLSVGDGKAVDSNYLFCFAVPPELFQSILMNLRLNGLTNERGGWRRFVFEKPFGTDLRSFRALEREVRGSLKKRQSYRIDHVLGMDSVQNIPVLRSGNPLLKGLWSNSFIDSVQIMMDETLGIEGRGGYYDRAGVVRDMVQNHLLQLLSLVAMELPSGRGGRAFEASKVDVLRATHPFSTSDVVLGQYTGYDSEKSVRPGSATPTFAAFRVWVDAPRWKGVPFYIRTGKRMARKATEVVVNFRGSQVRQRGACPNYLILRIQPKESVGLGISVRAPGSVQGAKRVEMVFDYREFQQSAHFGAYERLLLDVTRGDQSLFVSSEFEELAWARLDRVLAMAGSKEFPVRPYAAGTWGPDESELLLASDGRSWGPAGGEC